jgi:hypothetical protein
MRKFVDNLFWEFIFWLTMVKDLKRRLKRKTEDWPLFV